MEKTEEMRAVYSLQCPECGKTIKGTAASQVDYNLKVHIERKHNQNINKEEDKK